MARVLDAAGARHAASVPSTAPTVPPHLALAVGQALPPAHAEVVRDLLAAVLAGGDVTRETFAEVPPEQLVRWLSGAAVQPVPEGVHPLRPRIEGVAEVIDPGTMIAAARGIASSIDRLLTEPPTADPLRAPVEGCDLVDQPPSICIAGGGDNVHTQDYALSIDLGGADTYRNTAGGASYFAARNVSVVVDLAGDDTYETPPSSSCGQISQCGQGAGSAGIGMLVDASGSDTYALHGSARERPEANACEAQDIFETCGRLVAQGAGDVGVGVLADLAGDDSYVADFPARAVGSDGREAPEIVYAQGSSTLGLGLLWDDAGNDSYTIRGHATGFAKPEDQWRWRGWSWFFGQGYAALAFGVMVDSSGDDRLTMTVAPGRDAEGPIEASPWGQGGIAMVAGQGYAVTLSSTTGPPITAALVTGRGNTAYEMGATGRFWAQVQGQGFGNDAMSLATLDDAGGDDTYALVGRVDGEASSTCSCDRAVLTLDTLSDPWVDLFDFGKAEVYGQGAFAGNLRDRSGKDRYVAEAHSSLVATAANEQPGGDARVDARWVVGVNLWAQGAAGGGLRDDGGDDHYLLDASADLDASAIASPATEGTPGVVEALAFPGVLTVVGQGHNPTRTGGLLDRGGRDVYETRVSGSGSADPDPGGHDADPDQLVAVQGTNGTLVDSDAGEADAFRADAYTVFEVCAGRYGEAPGWVSGPTLRGGRCSPSWGTTIAPTTVVPGPETALSFQSAEPSGSDAYPTVEVALKLTDQAGNPLAGRRVIVFPEHRFATSDPFASLSSDWADVTGTSEDLVTGPDGVASGVLSVWKLWCESHPTSCEEQLTGEYRVRAMFFGEPGVHRPVTATSNTLQDA